MIPATPTEAATTTPDTLPVRHILVGNRATARGDYPAGFAWSGCKDRWYTDTDTMYTLIPPHLAAQWSELRKARHDAELAMLEAHKRDADANVVFAPHLFMAWSKAATNLVLFETLHGIGGGT